MRDDLDFDPSQIRSGDSVLGLNGDKIGSVEEVFPTYFKVSTGFLGLGERLYVPFDAVTRMDRHDIYLDVTKDEVHNRGWLRPPAEAAPGGVMAGTMPAGVVTPAPTYATMNPAAIQGGVGPTVPRTWLDPAAMVGKTLCDIDGKAIGNVGNAGPNYVVVTTGLLNLGPTLYVPITAVSQCTDDRCYLNMPLDELESMRWNQPPPEGMVGRGAAPGTPIQSPPASAGAETEQEIRVPVYEERVDVEKKPYVREEVVIQPEQVTEERPFTATVRREVADVREEGDVRNDVSFEGAAPQASFRPWAEVVPTYQQQWQQRYGSRGGTWAAAEPAYQFGYEAYNNPSYRGQSFAAVEPRLRGEWERQHPESAWDKVKNFVRDIFGG